MPPLAVDNLEFYGKRLGSGPPSWTIWYTYWVYASVKVFPVSSSTSILSLSPVSSVLCCWPFGPMLLVSANFLTFVTNITFVTLAVSQPLLGFAFHTLLCCWVGGNQLHSNHRQYPHHPNSAIFYDIISGRVVIEWLITVNFWYQTTDYLIKCTDGFSIYVPGKYNCVVSR